jgi:superfamily II RNA helicase
MDRVGFVVVLPGPYQDPRLILELLHSTPEPINSQIQINFSMVLNLLLSHQPEEIKELLGRSFATYQNLEEHRDLSEELQQLEKDISAELETAECGDLDTVLLTLSRKRELKHQLREARNELRRNWVPLFKQAYLKPGRLFRTKKGDLYVTLVQESRNRQLGVRAVRVWPRSRLRRGRLRRSWLRLEKVASLLDACVELDKLDTPEAWSTYLQSIPLDTCAPLEIKAPLPLPEREAWKAMKEQVEIIQAAIAALPCELCPHLSRCEPKRRSRFREQISRVQSVRGRVDEVTNQLWQEFNRHFHFLRKEGYLNKDGRLSVDGIWASQLRLDQPLMVAESIRREVFPQSDPAMLAGLIAPFVTDRDSHDEPLERLNLQHPVLGQAFAKMVSALHPLRNRMRQHGFAVSTLSFWPAATVYTWVSGSSWEELVKISGLDEGDLAMLIYRTADSLRQLEGLAGTHQLLADSATEAIQRLLREPVLVPT